MANTTKSIGASTVCVHDGSGHAITSTNGALDVNISSAVDVTIENAEIAVEINASDGDNIAIKDSTGTNALSISASGAAKVDGSAVTQPISGTVAISNLPTAFQTRSDTFTVAGNGIAVDASSNPKKYYTMVVKGTGGAAATWDVRLEGSLDNTNFSQILQHTNTTGDGAVLFIGASVAPALYFRARCDAVTLGGASSIVATILGVN